MKIIRDFFTRFEDRIMPEPMSGCWLWIGSRTPPGYGTISFSGQSYYAHRAAYSCSTGVLPPKGMVVRHKCDTPQCVNPDHLAIGTHKDNVDDAWERGRMHPLRGEDIATSIISEKQVLEARRLARNGASIADITRKMLGYSMNNWRVINYAVRGITWAHLPGAVTPSKKVGPIYRPVGYAPPNRKLSSDQVREIRERRAAGERNVDLSIEYGVSASTISAIYVGRNWPCSL